MIKIIDFFTGGWMRWALLALVLTAAVLFVRNHWIQVGREQVLRENVAVAQKIVVKQGAVTEKVVREYVKVAGATKVVTETVEKEVVKYATANTGMCLDDAWRLLHDRAAANALSSAPARPAGGLRTAWDTSGGGSPTYSSASPADSYLQLRAASSLR